MVPGSRSTQIANRGSVLGLPIEIRVQQSNGGGGNITGMVGRSTSSTCGGLRQGTINAANAATEWRFDKKMTTLLVSTIALLATGVQAAPAKQGQPHRYGEIIPLTKEEEAESERKFIEELRKEWAPRLTKICEVEGIDAMVFTLASPEYFPVWEKPHGVAGMRLLASATDTFWEQIDGVQVFSAVGERETAFGVTFLDALSALGPADIERIVNGEGTLEMFGPRMDAVAEKIALDSAMAQVLLERGSSASVAVQFYPHIRYRDPATGQVKRVGLASQGESEPFFTPEKEGQPLLSLPAARQAVGTWGFRLRRGQGYDASRFQPSRSEGVRSRVPY